MMKTTNFLALATAATLTTAALWQSTPAVTAAPAGGSPTIVEIADDAGRFTTLVAALQATGLDATLSGTGPFTVFAPTDAAFAKLPPGTVQNLLLPENQALLQAILLYHVVPGEVPAATAQTLSNAGTVNGQRVDLSFEGSSLFVDDALVTNADVFGSNGVVHVIDTVLLPETRDLIEVAADTGRFGTLAQAITTAQLAATLTSPGPFTVFAPTDHAFDALPAGTVENLLQPENQAMLVSVLLNHVADGRLYSDQLLTAGSFTNQLSVTIPVSVSGNDVLIGNARLVNSDFEATNGVVHVIDQVLLPQ